MVDVGVIGAFLAGMLVGAGFFGGLYWGIRWALSSANPAPWILGSQVVRTLCAVAGFWAISGGRLVPALSCLAGFLTVRQLVGRRIAPRGKPHAP